MEINKSHKLLKPKSKAELDKLLSALANMYIEASKTERLERNLNCGRISLEDYKDNRLNLEALLAYHTKLGSDFYRGIEDWDVFNITNFEKCFYGLNTFNVSLESWHAMTIENCRYMFANSGYKHSVSNFINYHEDMEYVYYKMLENTRITGTIDEIFGLNGFPLPKELLNSVKLVRKRKRIEIL